MSIRDESLDTSLTSDIFHRKILKFYKPPKILKSSLKVMTSLRTALVAQAVKCLPAIQETRVQRLGQEDLLEKEMATHSSALAWKIPWTEKPGRLQFMGSQRVGHDGATSLSLYTFTFWKWKSLSLVWLFTISWTVACQAPLSMGFSRPQHWSG